MKKYNCLHCNTECIKKPTSTGKYCSNICQREFEYHNKTKPAIERGEVHNPATLKKYMLREVGNECVLCGQGPEWNGKPLSLQMDHVDGDSDNCLPSNLRILCPNCHTQTETYGSKGNGSKSKKPTRRNSYIRKYRGAEIEG